MVASCFSCYPNAASLSRSSVLEASNGRTQLSFIFSSLIILIVILFVGPVFEPLPKACLAAIIVVALKNLLLQAKEVAWYWKVNKYEFVTWIATYLSVVLLDIDLGLFVGISVSIFTVLARDMLFKFANGSTVMPITKSFDSDLMRSIQIVNVNNSIYFLNSAKFLKNMSKALEKANENHLIEKSIENLIIDLSGVNYVDTNGIKVIQQLIDDATKLHLRVFLVNPQESLIRIAYKMNVLDKLDSFIYKSIEDALEEISIKETNSIL